MPLVAALAFGCGVSHATTRGSPDPSGLAATIDRAQAVVDDPSAPSARLQTAARSEQLAFWELARRPSARQAVLGQLSPAAHAAAAAALRASASLSKIVPAERRFPRWRIAGPPPPAKLLGSFRAAAATYRIPWQYLAAIELVETRMGRIHGLSPAGAKGPMQFEPSTWAEYGHGSIDSQHDSIMAAARFLVANGAHRSIGRALFHYNPSRWYVAAVESYAREMLRDARAYDGYFYWQVFYRTAKGTYVLPVGYPRVRPELIRVR